MQVASSHSGWQRWMLPILLGIAALLLFAALPGQPLQNLARDAGLMTHVRTEIATLHAARTGFQPARPAERDVWSGRSTPAQTLAISGVRQALDRMTGAAGPVGESVAAVRDTIAADELTRAAAVARDAEPAAPALPANAMDSVLGNLQARDEARLQEPLLAMRLAEAGLRSGRDPRLAAQMSRAAGIFATRLDELAIPQGTRTTLKASLAVYEHAVLSLPNASARPWVDQQSSQLAARVVEHAPANADRTLAAEQRRVNHAFETGGNGFLWSFGAALLIVGGAWFGRMALDRGMARARHVR
jgi:hypothetical protein